MQLSDLRDKHKGETVWVLGSGPSLNFITPKFFHDKITVSTNYSARAIGHEPDYVFSHYHEDALDLANDSGCVVTLARSFRDNSPFPEPVDSKIVLIQQNTHTPPGGSWNPLTTHPPREDSLAYGSSSLHGAMHLAAHLGASFIILVGADCGAIDGEDRVAGYVPGDSLWGLYNQHHKLMKDYLEQNYNVRVHSLNPFINLNLEGHTFHGPSATA
jgi:hypothetical protein